MALYTRSVYGVSNIPIIKPHIFSAKSLAILIHGFSLPASLFLSLSLLVSLVISFICSSALILAKYILIITLPSHLSIVKTLRCTKVISLSFAPNTGFKPHSSFSFIRFTFNGGIEINTNINNHGPKDVFSVVRRPFSSNFLDNRE